MTERGRTQVERTLDGLRIGPSSLHWDGNCLEICVRERAAPVPVPLRGTIRLYPETLTATPWHLDAARLHRWAPIAPFARVEVALQNPTLRWSGTGYLDSNHGDCALEQSFVRWDWSRSHGVSGGTDLLYDVTPRPTAARDAQGLNGDERRTLSLHIGRDGVGQTIATPPARTLPATRIWRIPRATHAAEEDLGVRTTLEDTPFYARSVLHSARTQRVMLHESLDLDRFRSPWVRALLPFRMPRRAG